jgi:hypothetical protein
MAAERYLPIRIKGKKTNSTTETIKFSLEIFMTNSVAIFLILKAKNDTAETKMKNKPILTTLKPVRLKK